LINIFKKKTELDVLRKEFNFLEKDFEYQKIKEEVNDYYKGRNLIVYKNDKAQKQIEICAGLSFFHCIIRKINNQNLSDYSNRIENIGFEDLAMLDNPEYDHFDFYAGGKQGVKGVTKNTVNLFKKQSDFFTNNQWIDISKIEQIKNSELKRKFKTVTKNKPEFFIEQVRNLIKSDFPEFKLIFNNDELPFYHYDSTLQRLIYENNGKEIKIEQCDWRDYPEIYSVFQNNHKIKEIDIRKFENKEKAIMEIKTACNTVYN